MPRSCAVVASKLRVYRNNTNYSAQILDCYRFENKTTRVSGVCAFSIIPTNTNILTKALFLHALMTNDQAANLNVIADE